MNGDRKEFDALFSSIKEAAKLPDRIKTEYSIISCFQYADAKQTYLVQRKTDGRKQILKCAQKEYMPFLKEEAELLRQEGFSFLPYLITYFEEGESAYLLREYIEGSTIWDIVEKHGLFRKEEALVILRQLIHIVKRLHEQKPPLIHRDLKPQNIVLTVKGECYLIDMGTARQLNDSKEHDTFVLGTRMIAAPEQFGYCQTDARTDIYSFGILMYYMLTGSMKTEENPQIPNDIWKIIQKCTEFDPKRRYQKAEQLEKEIRNLSLGKQKVSPFRKAAEAVVVLTAIFICLASGRDWLARNSRREGCLRSR